MYGCLQEGYAGWTALHIAAHRGDLSLAQSLLYKCPGVDHAARDYAERTPRRLAKRSHAFSTKEGQRIFKVLPEESDSETDDDDEVGNIIFICLLIQSNIESWNTLTSY